MIEKRLFVWIRSLRLRIQTALFDHMFKLKIFLSSSRFLLYRNQIIYCFDYYFIANIWCKPYLSTIIWECTNVKNLEIYCPNIINFLIFFILVVYCNYCSFHILIVLKLIVSIIYYGGNVSPIHKIKKYSANCL